MGFYPIFVDLDGRRSVVVGGGPIAERKVQGLRGAGATVTVVSPDLTAGLTGMVANAEISHVERRFRAGDLAGAHLAIVAVNDRRVRRAVAQEARRLRIWLNSADDPELCDFILPAVLRRGPLAIAVATGGASPALSRVVRDWLDVELPADLEELAAAAAAVRRNLRTGGRSPEPAVWREALERELRERLTGALGRGTLDGVASSLDREGRG